MASLLDKLSKEMTAAGIRPRTGAALSWIAQKARQLRIPSNRENVLNDASRIHAKAFIGRMYFFHYQAKNADTLPQWDKYPLVIPMETYDDGFLGLNLHYLDPYSRLALLDKLHDFISNNKYDETTSFRMSYSLLSKSRKYSIIQPCVKRYLFQYIMSSMIFIEPDNWETVCFLPLQKFVYN